MKTNCLECYNFKTRIVTNQLLRKRKTGEQLWQFPVGVSVLNKVRKEGKCSIYYCLLAKMNREVYINDGRSVMAYNPVEEPCLSKNMCVEDN